MATYLEEREALNKWIWQRFEEYKNPPEGALSWMVENKFSEQWREYNQKLRELNAKYGVAVNDDSKRRVAEPVQDLVKRINLAFAFMDRIAAGTVICRITGKPIEGIDCYNTSMVMEGLAPVEIAHVALTKDDAARYREICLTCPDHPK